MKRVTWIVLVIFLVLVGVLLYLNQNGSPATGSDPTPAETVEYLFSATDGLPTSIEIEAKSGEQVAIERNDEGVWVLRLPIDAEANQGSAEAAATQLSALRVLSRPEVAPAEAGLNEPSYTMTIKLTGGTVEIVRIGDLTPTSIGYYANFNGRDEILIVGKTGLDSLLTLVTSPPFNDAPSPTP